MSTPTCQQCEEYGAELRKVLGPDDVGFLLASGLHMITIKVNELVKAGEMQLGPELSAENAPFEVGVAFQTMRRLLLAVFPEGRDQVLESMAKSNNMKEAPKFIACSGKHAVLH